MSQELYLKEIGLGIGIVIAMAAFAVGLRDIKALAIIVLLPFTVGLFVEWYTNACSKVSNVIKSIRSFFDIEMIINAMYADKPKIEPRNYSEIYRRALVGFETDASENGPWGISHFGNPYYYYQFRDALVDAGILKQSYGLLSNRIQYADGWNGELAGECVNWNEDGTPDNQCLLIDEPQQLLLDSGESEDEE